ncbi:uncharacterized protein FIESC28_08492 [Fusarium coffeatum]|uniref:Uncharacterized protein n=1 Tax=Fusarium coffeatum TaxID=231269 RepID=A0A366R8Y9_9HYPO|nr:uncharacterized protein FIESC28_08492 [Fusarium coffeatum]RBR12790.1 hypothetical protein FIESC28_08492 [Fusarium coffeatum]
MPSRIFVNKASIPERAKDAINWCFLHLAAFPILAIEGWFSKEEGKSEVKAKFRGKHEREKLNTTSTPGFLFCGCVLHSSLLSLYYPSDCPSSLITTPKALSQLSTTTTNPTATMGFLNMSYTSKVILFAVLVLIGVVFLVVGLHSGESAKEAELNQQAKDEFEERFDAEKKVSKKIEKRFNKFVEADKAEKERLGIVKERDVCPWTSPSGSEV